MSAAPYAGISLALLATTAYNVGLIQESGPSGGCPPSTCAGYRAW